jgi:putative Ca2+/H+ antiporter (TMEM165/GDT1 family)
MSLRKPAPIIGGIFAATLVNHLIACLVGEWVGTPMTPTILRWVLGISFLAVAAWALIPDEVDENFKAHGNYESFALTAVTFFMAEMGDKTQTIALFLAAKYDALSEWSPAPLSA